MKKIEQVKLWPRVIYNNIAPIIIGIFVFSLCWTLFLKLTTHYLPPKYFIRNITATAYPTQEHKDVSLRICRDRRGDFTATGIRTVYQVADNKPKSSGTQVGRYSIAAFAIDGGRCDSTTIHREQYDFAAGNYYAHTSLRVQVSPSEYKSYSYDSNLFTIFPVQTSDIQEQIKMLNDEINRLKGILNIPITDTGSSTATTSYGALSVVPAAKPSDQNNQVQNPAQETGGTQESTDPEPQRCIINFKVPYLGTTIKAC